MQNSLKKNEKIDCQNAFNIVEELKISVKEFVKACNQNSIKFDNCQLGLFGEKKERLEDFLTKEISELSMELFKQNSITCNQAFDLAKKYNLRPIEVSANISKLGIKIKKCKLACF